MRRLAVAVAPEFPCIRSGRFALAMQNHRWQHDVICKNPPPQFAEAYRTVDWNPYLTYDWLTKRIEASDAELIHVHGDLGVMWAMKAAKDASRGRPVVLNVHDLMCARPLGFEPWEEEAFRLADGLVFVTEEQQAFARDAGYAIDKPTAIVPNYVSSTAFLDKPLLPHLDGVVYEGGCDKRNAPHAWRDLSAIADAIPLHIYSGGNDPDYGIVHPTEYTYPILIQRLAQHDWGFCGVAQPNDAWDQAIPTKFFDYLAAGIPVIAMNCPPVKPFCDMGLGVYLSDTTGLKQAVRLDPKPYKKAVKELRDQFTTERVISRVADLYDQLLGGK